MKTIELKDKKNNSYKCLFFVGSEIIKNIPEVAQFRIKYFRDYPYLYEGNIAEEEKYLKGFCEDSKSLLLLIKDSSGETIAVSTSLPLISNSTILAGVPELFESKGLSPEVFFYYGEVIISLNYRSLGLTRKIFSIQEEYGKSLGLSSISLSTVFRESSDPRRPENYTKHNLIWFKMGFKKTDIRIDYEWPTIQANGEVKNIKNPMVFFIKEIQK